MCRTKRGTSCGPGCAGRPVSAGVLARTAGGAGFEAEPGPVLGTRPRPGGDDRLAPDRRADPRGARRRPDVSAVVDSSAVAAALVDDGVDGEWARRSSERAWLAAPAHMFIEVSNVLRREVLAGSVGSRRRGARPPRSGRSTGHGVPVRADGLQDLGAASHPSRPMTPDYVALAEALDVPGRHARRPPRPRERPRPASSCRRPDAVEGVRPMACSCGSARVRAPISRG